MSTSFPTIRPDRWPCPAARGRRAGLTLLEVVLSLSISAIVLSMLATAVRLHMRMLDTQRIGVEQAELAREILRQIALDLQSAAAADPTSGQLLLDPSSDSSSDSSSGGQPAADGTNEQTATAIDPSQQTAVGLYGTMTELRFECTRARRFFSPASPSSETVFLANSLASQSELQTVTYYLGSDSQSADSSRLAAPTNVTGSSTPGENHQLSNAQGTGLLRRRMDHAQFMHQIVSGGGSNWSDSAEMLADEVVMLTFRYFDGMQWLDQWDSTAQQGLPVAVEVTLVIDSRPADEREALAVPLVTSFSQLPSAGSDPFVFQRVICLPVAQPTWDVEAEY